MGKHRMSGKYLQVGFTGE